MHALVYDSVSLAPISVSLSSPRSKLTSRFSAKTSERISDRVNACCSHADTRELFLKKRLPVPHHKLRDGYVAEARALMLVLPQFKLRKNTKRMPASTFSENANDGTRSSIVYAARAGTEGGPFTLQ